MVGLRPCIRQPRSLRILLISRSNEAPYVDSRREDSKPEQLRRLEPGWPVCESGGILPEVVVTPYSPASHPRIFSVAWGFAQMHKLYPCFFASTFHVFNIRITQ